MLFQTFKSCNKLSWWKTPKKYPKHESNDKVYDTEHQRRTEKLVLYWHVQRLQFRQQLDVTKWNLTMGTLERHWCCACFVAFDLGIPALAKRQNNANRHFGWSILWNSRDTSVDLTNKRCLHIHVFRENSPVWAF